MVTRLVRSSGRLRGAGAPGQALPRWSVAAIKLNRHTGMDAGIQAMDGNYQMA